MPPEPRRPKSPRYPDGTARRLLATDLVTPPTRESLLSRLKPPSHAAPAVLSQAEMETLRAICNRLITQPDRALPIDLSLAVDDRLARNDSKGWRYAALPADLDAYRLGVLGIDQEALHHFGMPFAGLDVAQQDELLRRVQVGDVRASAWRKLPAGRFFEELLAELAETYYSHPFAQDEIGYVGYADAHGWQALGLGQLAPHEPLPEGQKLHLRTDGAVVETDPGGNDSSAK